MFELMPTFSRDVPEMCQPKVDINNFPVFLRKKTGVDFLSQFTTSKS